MSSVPFNFFKPVFFAFRDILNPASFLILVFSRIRKKIRITLRNHKTKQKLSYMVRLKSAFFLQILPFWRPFWLTATTGFSITKIYFEIPSFSYHEHYYRPYSYSQINSKAVLNTINQGPILYYQRFTFSFYLTLWFLRCFIWL